MSKYLREGSAYYLKHDYKKAIGPYRKALDKVFFRVLVDNLGMAYGMTGNLKQARETFEYGLSRDPQYPMFYYNLACTYAEMNDLDGAIAQLRHAFEYRENQNPGESMPDPRTDDSFQRYRQNPRFLSALEEMEKATK